MVEIGPEPLAPLEPDPGAPVERDREQRGGLGRFGAADRTLVGAVAMRRVDVVDSGNSLLLELDTAEGGTLAVAIPARLGLDLGTELMTRAAEARSVRAGR